MAARGKTSSRPARAVAAALPSRWKRRGRLLLIAGWIVLGGVLFNLDRLDRVGVELLRFRSFLPAPARLLLPGGSAAEAAADRGEELRGRIIEVYDGDTATLLSGDGTRKYRIRFYGIDAPEAAQSYGVEARDRLREWILDREVRVEVMARDPYGRTVGRVYGDDGEINRKLVEEGCAWYYAAYAAKAPELADVEAEARRFRRGLWRADAPTPPWEFRKQGR